jgi:hypothetical protein
MIQIESLSATKNPRSFIRRFISFPKSLYQKRIQLDTLVRCRHAPDSAKTASVFTYSEGEAFLALGGVESAVGFWW